jgi:hypothetical protein
VPAAARSRTRRSAPSKRRRPPPPAPRPAPSRPAAPLTRALLAERPHAHIVCRGCGRIAPVVLETEEELRLEAIARAAPEGWSVDLVAFSLTGACPRCQQGPAVPE